MDWSNKEDNRSPDESSPGPPTLAQNILDFGRVILGSQKTLQQIIANTTRKPMIWLADTSESRWLTVEPDHGVLQPGERRSLRVTVDTSSLEIGEHFVTLTFSSEGDTTSMHQDTVAKAVVDPPALLAGLDFGWITPHSTQKMGLVITNPDQEAINWNIQIDTESGSRERLENGSKPTGMQESFSVTQADGIHLSENTGTLAPGQTHTVSVAVNTAQLATPYVYKTNLILTATKKDASTAFARMQVPITFYVNKVPYNDGGPRVPIDLLTNINLAIAPAQQSAQYTLSFTNDNLKQVSWSLKIDPGVGWLTANQTQGMFNPGQKASILLTASKVGLSQGSYQTGLDFVFNWDPPVPGEATPVGPIPFYLNVQ